MRIIKAFATVAAVLSLSAFAIETVSARVTVTSSRTVSNGFTTCNFIKQTSFGISLTATRARCASADF